MSTLRFSITCPYCGMVQIRYRGSHSGDNLEKAIETCDFEEGGCDRDFVVAYEVMTHAETFAIDGKFGKDAEGYKGGAS